MTATIGNTALLEFSRSWLLVLTLKGGDHCEIYQIEPIYN